MSNNSVCRTSKVGFFGWKKTANNAIYKKEKITKQSSKQ